MKNFRLLIILGLVGLLTQGCGQFNPIEGTEGGSPFTPEATEGGISAPKVTIDFQSAPYYTATQRLITDLCATNVELYKSDGSLTVLELNTSIKIFDTWRVWGEFEIEEGFYTEMIVNTERDCDTSLDASPWQPSVSMWFNEFHKLGYAGKFDYFEPSRVRFAINQEINEAWPYITIDSYNIEQEWKDVTSYEEMGEVLQSDQLF